VLPGTSSQKNLGTGEVTNYYYASAKRIAMRQGDALYWIHGDHLGRTLPVERRHEEGDQNEVDGLRTKQVEFQPFVAYVQQVRG